MNALSEPQEFQIAPAPINPFDAFIVRVLDYFQLVFNWIRWTFILAASVSLISIVAHFKGEISIFILALSCLNMILLIPGIVWVSSARQSTCLYTGLSNLIGLAQASQVHLPAWNGSEHTIKSLSELFASCKSLLQWVSGLSNNVYNIKNTPELKSSLDSLVSTIKSLTGAFNPISIIVVTIFIYISFSLSIITISRILFF